MRRLAKGDSLIELVIAFAIFSLAAVGTIAILNRGLATTQRSLEATLVRQQIDSQAEMIRYIHDSGSSTWSQLIAGPNLVSNPAEIGTTDTTCPTPPSGSSFFVRSTAVNTFVRQSTAANYLTIPATYAKMVYASPTSSVITKSEGIWVQAAQVNQTSNDSLVKAYDFYVHACWMSVGTDIPITLGTIVRVYDN